MDRYHIIKNSDEEPWPMSVENWHTMASELMASEEGRELLSQTKEGRRYMLDWREKTQIEVQKEYQETMSKTNLKSGITPRNFSNLI